MQWLAAISVKRPVFATVIVLLLTVVGVFAYVQLGIDRFPKVDFPAVTVTTILPGSAPDEIESEISDKLEAAVELSAASRYLCCSSAVSASASRTLRVSRSSATAMRCCSPGASGSE